jgi:hypothetical protein
MIMIHITFSIFADLMLLGTIPLMVGLGYWEHNLKLTDTDHILVQLILALIVFGWAYMWNSLRIRDRLTHAAAWNMDEMAPPDCLNYSSRSHFMPGFVSSDYKDDISNEIVRKTMFQTIRPALVIFALLTILTGVLYPLLITGRHKYCSRQANGSIVGNGWPYWFMLIGQSFQPEYFCDDFR